MRRVRCWCVRRAALTTLGAVGLVEVGVIVFTLGGAGWIGRAGGTLAFVLGVMRSLSQRRAALRPRLRGGAAVMAVLNSSAM